MKFREKFTASKRSQEMSGVDSYIRGESKDSPLFREVTTQESLDSNEESARKSSAENPNNFIRRQLWLYNAALARDSAYTNFRRRRLKANGLNGLYMELYGGAKIAKDSGNSE